MKVTIYMFFGGLIFWFSSGCATLPEKDFEQLKVGMNKAEVLETMGTPKSSYRADGNDIWLYRGSTSHDLKVVFRDGKVNQKIDPTMVTPAKKDKTSADSGYVPLNQ